MTRAFENFLMMEHAKEYHGTDDDMPDAFEAWLEKLDGNDLIEFGNKALETINEQKEIDRKLSKEVAEEMEIGADGLGDR